MSIWNYKSEKAKDTFQKQLGEPTNQDKVNLETKENK